MNPNAVLEACSSEPPAASPGSGLDTLLDRAQGLAQRGEAGEGRALAEQVLGEARLRADDERIARALGIIANASRTLEDFERAASAALECVDVLESAGSGLAPAKLDLALVYFDLGDYPRTLSYLREVRRALADAPDRIVESRCAHVEGLVQSRLDEFALARVSFQRVLSLRRDDPGGAAITLNSLGVLHLRLAQRPGADPDAARREVDAALSYFRQSLGFALQHGDAHLALLSEINIAGALGTLGRFDEALERFLAQLATARSMGDRSNESLILSNAGEAARLSGQIDRARELGEEALAVAEVALSKVREREARLQLSLTCEAAGDFAAALAHYKSHHSLEREASAAEARRFTQAQAMRGAIERSQREATRLRVENRTLERQALRDALTGLANRRAFDDALSMRVEQARRAGQALAVVAFDLDHFKSVNDRYTHAGGDSVLKEVAKVLRAQCRSSDLAARIGGEEFVLLLPGADRVAACAVAERVRSEVASHEFAALAPGVHVTLSAGVAVDGGSGGGDALLRAADAALYCAKGEGRDRVCVRRSSLRSTPGCPSAGAHAPGHNP